jgi:hypothetical protein
VTKQDEANRQIRDAAMNEIRQTYERVRSAIEAIPEPQQAYEAASQLRDFVDDLVGDAATLRARMAHRIVKAEKLSLAALASRINVSKARADQLIRAAKAADVDGTD